MALLDVTEVLLDPDFIDSMTYLRNAQVVGTNGVATITPPVPVPMYGVVTSRDGDTLTRGPDGEYNEDSITIHTMTRLISGEDDNTADIVMWDGKPYTVMHVNNYSHFGAGFVAADCDKKPLRR